MPDITVPDVTGDVSALLRPAPARLSPWAATATGTLACDITPHTASGPRPIGHRLAEFAAWAALLHADPVFVPCPPPGPAAAPPEQPIVGYLLAHAVAVGRAGPVAASVRVHLLPGDVPAACRMFPRLLISGTRPEVMLAITVRQPYAGLIAARHKPVENRTWTTRHRGLLAIHAGKAPHRGADPGALTRLAHVSAADLDTIGATRGAVVAVAALTGVCRGDPGCGCGPWAWPGHHHFQLADVVALPTPVPARGAQRLFPLAASAAAQVRAQLRGAAA